MATSTAAPTARVWRVWKGSPTGARPRSLWPGAKGSLPVESCSLWQGCHVLREYDAHIELSSRFPRTPFGRSSGARHGRTSAAVELHSLITAFCQHGSESEPGRLGVLGLMRRRRRTRGRILSDSTHTEAPNFASCPFCEVRRSSRPARGYRRVYTLDLR